MRSTDSSVEHSRTSHRLAYPSPAATRRPTLSAERRRCRKALRPVLGLLLVNLALSIGLTIAVLILHNSVIDYQLDHEHITEPAGVDSLRHSYQVTLWRRVAGNIVLSVVYAFLVRALLRGRRWAYRRVIFIGAIGHPEPA